MKKLILSLLISSSCFAVYNVGDALPNKCWEDASGKKTCLKDLAGSTVVLLHNAGWCGPCNTEFSSIAKEMEPYANGVVGKSGLVNRVVFVSLSCDGWSGGSGPSARFLTEWAARYRLNSAKADFRVLASPRDCGRDFFSSPSIPNVEIICYDGYLKYKGVNPSAATIKAQINALIQ